MIQKFYFPLTVYTYERRDWGIDWDDSIEGDGRTAIRYRGDIENAFERYNDGDDMARYFSRSETVKAKIQHCEWRFENFDGCLYGLFFSTLPLARPSRFRGVWRSVARQGRPYTARPRFTRSSGLSRP